ncbi:hypothetical protein [Arcobacter sp. CECT 8985]|uniref:hypothetical protein n=1 Tax=Arcobacter sp. CECT 8985 TaxID=1935424 RepID=UPI00100B74DE|nr:hypothetical protein [Arcobacter sp. CECT 8985]RXJ86117.1 hypothetical protein CRU93_10220 [Arcobacter sp. CECT 8985]
MNLILISDTAIIIKIFTLICKKLDLKLHVQNNLNVENSTEFIIIDQNFINDKFNNFKKYCSKLGAISNDELPFDKARDFIIPRPFLPLQLKEILSEQIKFLKEEDINEKKQASKEATLTNKVNLDDDASDLTNYVESLADDIAADIEDDSDESIVTLASLREGGVLDNNELSKITDILRYEDVQNQVIKDEADWKELSDIIDDALTEVNEYDLTHPSEPLKLILNKYSIDELKPLLKKFDQSVIDKLSNGEDVDLKLSLKGKENA